MIGVRKVITITRDFQCLIHSIYIRHFVSLRMFDSAFFLNRMNDVLF